jgi:hypothetical protein
MTKKFGDKIGYEYCFIPTGIGDLIIVKAKISLSNKTIKIKKDITDIDSW